MTPDFELAIAGMRDIAQWFVWKLTWDAAEGKYQKVPFNGYDKISAKDSANWLSYDVALSRVRDWRTVEQEQGITYALGFWLTSECGYWLLDIDKARTPTGQWVQFATQLVDAFPGAMVEASSSGKGLHVIGRGVAPVGHRNKPAREIKQQLTPLELEFYSNDRGIAFGLDGVARGSADMVCDVAPLIHAYFGIRVANEASDGPRADWRGPLDDDVLIERMLNGRQSAASAFGGKWSVQQLWRGEVSPDDRSEADMALASHLAFWTGCDAARIERIMRRSGLVRDKWNDHRPGGTYLTHTIERACGGVDKVYQERQPLPLPTAGEDGSASATSDLANARRLVQHHGQDLMHVPGIGWHVWKGGPWQLDDGHAQRLAFGLGRIIQAEADALDACVNDETMQGTDEAKQRADYQKTLHRWARSSEFVVSVRHTLDAAQTLLSVKADELDANPLLVGTPSGVIDLTTGQQREHRREDRITKRIACDYDPAARAPLWDAFVRRIMGSDRELTAYLQTICGYMLSGKRGEHALPVFHGSGKNGKSTFLGIVQTLMGDYAGTAAPGLLLHRKDADQLASIAALRGLRLVVASESGETERLDESRVKLITGGDRLTGRALYQNFVEFTPTHLAILQTNHRPRVSGTDDGIWRRLKLVPFAVTIPENERDPELPSKLRAELPGILAWCVEGWRMYQAHGFREPEAVAVATGAYRSTSDQVGQFVNERCVIGQEHTATSSGLYNSYRIWCAENGEPVMSNKAFSLKLCERPGLVKVKQPSGMTWRGLAIASYAELGHIGGKVVPLPARG